MGHVQRKNSLRPLWSSFLVYNVARSAVAMLRGNWVGAKLCLAQTAGLWSGFHEPASAPTQAATDLHIVRRRETAGGIESKIGQLPLRRSVELHEHPVHAAAADYYSNDELVESHVGSSTA
jgi:hypothetical protein